MPTATTGEEITENSVPDLDDWGWDTFWTCIDWTEWHKIMKAKKGKQYADATFLQYWNKGTMGAHVADCRSFDQNFRDYMRNENLLSSLYSGIGVIAQPIGTAGDVITSGLEATSSFAKTFANIFKVLKTLLPIGLVIGAIILGIWAYKKFAK